jgi:5-methylcytosine-specific restriction enzyme subunit McrC
MSIPVLIENGPWERMHGVDSRDSERVKRSVANKNRHLKQSLGLRQDPIELRVIEGAIEMRARGIAGTLSTKDFVLDISPKFVPSGQQEWSNCLLMLVRYAHPRHIVFSRGIYLDTASLSFIDLLAMAFIDAFQAGFSNQLIQIYKVQEVALPTLRGRLNIQRQVRSYFQRPHLMECDVDQLDSNNAYNNLLKWGAQTLAASVRSAVLRRRLDELDRKLPGSSNVELAIRHPVITPPPQFRAWEPALDICSLLFSGGAHANNRGTNQGYSFVFNMERLFEYFIENLLKRSVSKVLNCILTSHRQVSTLYARSKTTTRSFYSKPDNLLTEGTRAVAVVDAKYKRLSDTQGIKNRKPQNQDVYELVAAMTAHQCKIGLLVYPKVSGDSELKDGQLQVWYVDAFDKQLTVGAIAVDLMELRYNDGIRRLEFCLAEAIDSLLLESMGSKS